MNFYAHTLPDAPRTSWEPLFTPFGDGTDQCQGENCGKCRDFDPSHGHLNKVAWWTAKFAAGMFPEAPEIRRSLWGWGYLSGLWHDLGKFSPEWQDYLASKADPQEQDSHGRVDHSSAGAQLAAKTGEGFGHVLAYGIAGHHSGLLDAVANGACQRNRLEKDALQLITGIPSSIIDQSVPSVPLSFKSAQELAVFTRMLFSCLVDADFLATEAFMNPTGAAKRNKIPEDIITKLAKALDAHIDGFPQPAPEDKVNILRRKVVEDCRKAASWEPGLFSLTVPTGGGNTLSSMSFALRHAQRHGMKRVIHVAPFTSIIEQTAEVFRKILTDGGEDGFIPVIEHHSALAPESESATHRLGAENWDAPVIITTAVQFFESLHAARTSRCRKLHRIANSVIVLDEAQTLPVELLKPCLRVLQELGKRYHASIVLCTATQPAINHDPADFDIGLHGVREIINRPHRLHVALKRVELEDLGRLDDETLAARLQTHSQALCIVNRRTHARELFQKLGGREGDRHLSALMCPEHRSRAIAEIRARLDQGLPTRVVATRLIEAGVDIDFPVVYRALAGLDSIAQAAGRCNRNGKLDGMGHAYVFRPQDQRAESFVRDTAQVAAQCMELHADPLSLEAVHSYFEQYYWRNKDRWDIHDISGNFHAANDRILPLGFQFVKTAESFRFIDDWQVPVLIPYDDTARSLIAELRNPTIPLHRTLLRGLQRYVVQIPKRVFDENTRNLEALRSGAFHALVSTDLHYSPEFGLIFDDSYSSQCFLSC